MGRLREKLTYANVMATIAVFLMLAGGTAFAASEMLPSNSVGTKQIKKEAVTPAKLSKASKAALIGPQGAPGAAGATGAQGPKGEKGAPGADAQILASGQTEVGVWGAAAEISNYGVAAINFAPRLENSVPASNVKFLNERETTPACPAFRHAAAGYLCVYTTYTGGMEFIQFANGFDNSEGADSTGVVLYVWNPSTGLKGGNITGNWAYTAP